MSRQLTYEKHHVDENDVKPFVPGVSAKLYIEPDDLRLSCLLVKYEAGYTLRDWCLYHNEIYIVQKGSAKCTVSFAPTFSETKEFGVGPGDVFYLPLGTKLTFEVGLKEPWVYLAVTVPSINKL